ncbi:hypothetical protein KKG65_03890 [Patescibacteria group bacterium]|nr:hypothetical protein [Patescibacteria group bacterium]MBU1200221.1 hypothetical protein [Patescibacteria group bacterium]MBU1256156.1 hypothetical protein [Patescibacteria group bacterium]MBU1457902.1 hypothetical protein [Patescibacteria group bacterium]
MLLTHRTNLLLEETDYHLLSQLASQNNVSMGKLIRQAVKQTYTIPQINTTAKILSNLQKLGQQINTKGINYKELIAHGRK